MASRMSTTRRSFLKAAGAAVVMNVPVPTIVRSSSIGANGAVAPSNRINVGVIGMGRQTVFTNLRSFLSAPDCQVVALCDVDRWRLNITEHRMPLWSGGIKPEDVDGIARYTDFREMLERKDLDAVMIATPDHWHVPMSVAAIEAGKHVCCEKPLTRSIAEGRLLSDLATRRKCVFRTDSEFRSIESFHRACELVRNGRIGKLHTIRTGVPLEQFEQPVPTTEPVPGELDYNLWLGPAAEKPYQGARVHQRRSYDRGGWMRVRDYCDGMVTNWGTHLNDIAQWGNNTDRSGPVEVEGRGKYPPKGSMYDVLQEFEITYLYAEGVRLIYRTQRPYVRFEGSEGWLEAEFGKKLQAHPDSLLGSRIGPDEVHLPFKNEKRDFIDCVKTGGQTLEDAEVGHRTTSLCHLGQIAVQVGKRLKWDPAAERFTNSDEANKLLALPPGREWWKS